MDTEYLDEQIWEMAEEGWGAFFIHPRYGISVDYLSDEWKRKVDWSVETAIDAGVDPWLYDEFLWPSGYGNGEISAKGAEYRIKFLLLRKSPRPEDDVLDVFERGGEMRYVCRAVMDGDEYGTAGGDAYTDLMNADVVEECIHVAYDGYADAVGDHFGDAIPGVFTDEPQIGHPGKLDEIALAALPWTLGLPTLFRERHGYDLLDHLPSLFYERDTAGRAYESVRYDFWRLVTTKFVGTYTKRLAEWCDDRNLKLVGHYLLEDTLAGQIPAAGAVMPHYEYEHMPGIDFLGRQIGGNGTALAAKQASSAARQFDRTAFSELYGCSGQQCSFETRKWLGDWHLVHGITFLNHHLSLYSMRGERKRDYPPNVFYQQPWWEYNDRIADYFARTVYALRQGEAVADTLLLHPVQTGWLEYSGGVDDSGIENLDDALADLVDRLLGAHVNFDFGDEILMESAASVDGEELRVGEVSYGRVVLPYCKTLQSSTVELLEAFLMAGGDVLVVGDPPDRVDGRRDTDTLNRVLAEAENAVFDDVVDTAPRPVRLVGDNGAETAEEVRLHVRRQGDGTLIVFAANTNPETGHDATLRFEGEGDVAFWDPLDGDSRRVDTTGDGVTDVEVSIPRSGSLLATFDSTGRREGGEAPRALLDSQDETVELTNSEWRLERRDPNALVIDECDLFLDGEDLGTVDVSEGWIHPHRLDDPAEHVPFEATYWFDIHDAVADSSLSVVVESASEVDISVNGEALVGEGDRWRDVHWRRFDITRLIQAGENRITVAGKRTQTAGVEPVFVLGDFAVRDAEENHELVPETPIATPANLTQDGYPFFTGELDLETTVDIEAAGDAILVFDEVHAALARIRVNGGEWHEVYWPPWEVPVEVEAGTNRITVRLVTSLRNLTGPHHAQELEPVMVSPYSFRPTDRNGNATNQWNTGYNVVPIGVEEPRLRLK
jgi:hypothetical protein